MERKGEKVIQRRMVKGRQGIDEGEIREIGKEEGMRGGREEKNRREKGKKEGVA